MKTVLASLVAVGLIGGSQVVTYADCCVDFYTPPHYCITLPKVQPTKTVESCLKIDCSSSSKKECRAEWICNK